LLALLLDEAEEAEDADAVAALGEEAAAA